MTKNIVIYIVLYLVVGLLATIAHAKSRRLNYLMSIFLFLNRESEYSPLSILLVIARNFLLIFLSCFFFRWLIQTLFETKESYGLFIPFVLVLLAWIVGLVKFFRKYDEIIGQKSESNKKVKLDSLGFYFKTDKGKIIVNNPFRGIFISGGAGSGKSKSLIEPIIQQASEKSFSGIVYDFKFPTLANEVKGCYEGNSVKTYYVNFSDLSRTYRVNPLNPDIITNVIYARQASLTILSNIDLKAVQKRDFWVQSAETILTASIWYLRKNHPKYCTLPHVISLILEVAPDSLINLLLSDEETSGLMASVNSARKSDNTIASILATIQNFLSVLNTKEIFWVLSGNDFTLDLNNPQEPKMLVVGNDDSISKAISPVIALIISSSLRQMNKPNKQQSIVILDEAPTISIPNFAQIPATARVNKVATVYCVQDISQMENDLGKEESATILSNLGTQFFGRTTSTQTAERVSKLFGEYDKEIEGRSKTKGESVQGFETTYSTSSTKSVSIQRRKILEESELISAETGKFATIVADGNIKKIFAKYKEEPSKAREIEPFIQISEQALSDNFKKIKNDIFSI